MAKKATHHFFCYWFPALLYCLLIFVQSSLPTPENTPEVLHIDKVLHVTAYALLGILFLRGFRNSRLENHYRLISMVSILLTGIYGVTDELHQYYVPYRSADLWDIIFDFVGGFLGVHIYQRLLEKYPKLGHV